MGFFFGWIPTTSSHLSLHKFNVPSLKGSFPDLGLTQVFLLFSLSTTDSLSQSVAIDLLPCFDWMCATLGDRFHEGRDYVCLFTTVHLA